MALVYDQLPILTDDVVNDTFLAQALNHRNVNLPGRLVPAAPDLSDLFWRKSQKSAQRFNPLVEHLATMNNDQCIHFALSNQVSGYNGLAESCRSGQNACLVL